VSAIAEIFRRYGPGYRARFDSGLPQRHRRAMLDLETCRTAARGGHAYFCPECATTHFSYRSCKNRHCPTCQGDDASDWLERQQALLLPGPHSLVTFTVPQELRMLVRSNQKLLLNILFRTSFAALQLLARDPKFLGGQIGAIGVLHTWTRDLVYHPHVHFLVPAGALDDGQWKSPRRRGFLVPVRALSILFRAKFRDEVEKTALFTTVPPDTWTRSWVVHAKSVGTGEKALSYLARYVFRVALSDDRIVSDKDGLVTFRYKDSRTGQLKLCALAAEEFLRRFLQHVLPPGFVKVRYYGLFAPRNRVLLDSARTLLLRRYPTPRSLAPAGPRARRPPDVCPTCNGPMTLIAVLRRSPP
jgi:hypothetical protein